MGAHGTVDAADRRQRDRDAAAAQGGADCLAIPAPHPGPAAACMSRAPRSRLLPAAVTAVVTLVCLALGVWQLERLEWKTGLIAARQAAVHAAPVPLPKTLEQASRLEF